MVSFRGIDHPTRTLTGCLSGDTLKDIVDKGVEDGHRLVGDTSVRVHLLEHYKHRSESFFALEVSPRDLPL